MKKPASFDKLADLTPAERAANIKYAAFLEAKAKRNKAYRERKTAKLIDLTVKVKQSNRTIEYTREEWLMTAVQMLRPIFAERGYIIPDTAKVTLGFPSVGGRGKRIGECHSPAGSTGGFTEMFISPLLDDTHRVLGVLVHECIHAAIGCEHGHNARFRKAMTALNLEGKPTATTEGAAFHAMVAGIVRDLGKLPHKALSLAGKKTQKTRMLKVECPCCGFKYRAARAPLLEASSVDVKGRFLHCPSPNCESEIVFTDALGQGRKLAPTRIYLDIDEKEETDEEE